MSSEDTQFKKGMKPWNKGIKGYMGSNTTSFKKGQVPHNKKVPLSKICPECRITFYVKQSLARVECCSKRCSQKKRLRVYGHPNWIEDRSKLKKDRIQAYDYAYRFWMRQVKNRDSWRCMIYNSECSGRVEAHHILSWREHPELRYELSNGITLCHFHHPRRKEDEKRLQSEFQALVSVSSETI